MLSGDSATSFLVGHLAQQQLTPLAVLRVSQGRVPAPTSQQVLAVTSGHLWLAATQLIGSPTVASVPRDEVGEGSLRPARRLFPGRSGSGVAQQLDLLVQGRRLSFTILDDAAAGAAFVGELAARR